MRTSALAIGVALLALAGCGAPCARNSDCASGYVCTVQGECVVPPNDGGVDASTGADAGGAAIDAASTVDASTIDALLDAPSPVMNGAAELDSKSETDAMGAPSP